MEENNKNAELLLSEDGVEIRARVEESGSNRPEQLSNISWETLWKSRREWIAYAMQLEGRLSKFVDLECGSCSIGPKGHEYDCPEAQE